jgi:hypothetical protein
MGLHSPTLPTSIVFQTSPCGIKSIADGHVEIFIGLAIHHQLGPGHAQIDAHDERPFAVVPAQPFHDHPAVHDAVVIGIEMRRLGVDSGLRRLGKREVPDGYLQR